MNIDYETNFHEENKVIISELISMSKVKSKDKAWQLNSKINH